jgi:hypothetical protein
LPLSIGLICILLLYFGKDDRCISLTLSSPAYY